MRGQKESENNLERKRRACLLCRGREEKDCGQEKKTLKSRANLRIEGRRVLLFLGSDRQGWINGE